MTINEISVKFIEHSAQRYDTCGDYFVEGDTLQVRISRTGNSTYDRMVLIHELAEWLITDHQGITGEAIDAFDLAYKGDGEPGDEKDSPYRDAHCFATGIERMLCGFLGIPWQTYDETIEAMAQ